MKRTSTLLTLFLAACGLTASAQEPVTFDCVADTWIRENNTGWKQSGNDLKKIEVRKENLKEKNDEGQEVVVGQCNFAGLIGFEFEIPEGKKVDKAIIHIVTERYKGADIQVWGFDHDFENNNATWASEKSAIDAAFQTTPMVFTPAGQWNKAISDTGIEANMQNLAAWANEWDVTSYVKTLPKSTSRVNFLLTQESNVNQNCFFTIENEGTDAFKQSDNTFVTNFEADQLKPYLEVTFVEDVFANKDVILPLADTFIRGNGDNKSTENHMEIGGPSFMGLMKFQLPAEVMDTENYEVTGVSLRLVTTQCKGDREFKIYDYENDFAENTNANLEGEYPDNALATEPVATFKANGFGSMSMGDDKPGNWTGFTTVDAWTNTIDLTNYVLGKIENGDQKFNILISRPLNNDKMKIATKEATDITNSGVESNGGESFTFKAEDLWPQLTVTYRKVNFSVQELDMTVVIDKQTKKITVTAPEGFTVWKYEEANDYPTWKEIRRNADAPLEEDEPENDPNDKGKYEDTKERVYVIETPTPNTTYYFKAGTNDGKVLLSNDYHYAIVAGDGASTAVEAIEAAEGVAEYYTLDGVRVSHPEHGIFIRVAGGRATKVIL